MIELIFMRHGQTVGNLEHRYNGVTDEPLCTQGIAACDGRGADPDVRKVFVSPLLRARQTAQLCFPNARQVVVEDLRETDFGVFEGKNYDDLKDDERYRAWIGSGCEDSCSGGETRTQFATRVVAAFDEIARVVRDVGEQQLVIVAHGGTIMSVMEHRAKERRTFYDWHVPNCGGYRAAIAFDADGRPVIVDPVPL